MLVNGRQELKKGNNLRLSNGIDSEESTKSWFQETLQNREKEKRKRKRKKEEKNGDPAIEKNEKKMKKNEKKMKK